MKQIVLSALFAALAISTASAQQVEQQSREQQGKSWRAEKADHAKEDSCAQYGAGFAKVPGTDTCMKVGGSISVDSGGTMRR
jgi:Porin subfamily